MKDILKGLVVSGINNIYTVKEDGKEWICRIKGKVLRAKERFYNPIAVGDVVIFLPDTNSEGTGWITGIEERKSYIMRWNKKRRAPQILASNVNILFIVVSVFSPPFRHRFIDRLLISAAAGLVDPVIIVNKIDLGVEEDVRQRIEVYRRLGYKTVFSSAVSGKGIDKISRLMRNRLSVFIGQSGVGKSSILNRISPELAIPTGMVSAKHNRGKHTTNYAKLYHMDDGVGVIDTPGIRELDIYGIEPDELHIFFPEFGFYRAECQYPSCKHLVEPGCAVRKALEQGGIDPERYESYVRIYHQLKREKRYYYG